MPGKGKKAEKNKKIKSDFNSPKKRYANAGGAGPEGFGEGGLDELLAPQEEKTDDPWAKKENWEEFVMEKPEPESFLRRERFEKDDNEMTAMNPVFETHSFWDTKVSMHSYMGLRYTKFDRKNGRLARKHIKIGFGSKWGMINQGRLMNEEGNMADASSETPISKDRFENVIDALERTNGNIDRVGRMSFWGRLFRSGKAKGTEFSGKYNLLTNNCNDFVITMAKAAGVETPATLHKSVWGPMAAAKNLSNAAGEEKLAGGTRIFNGATIDTADRRALLTDFMPYIRKAAKADGINLSKEPELEAVLLKISEQSENVRKMIVGSAPGEEQTAGLAGLDDDIKKALHFNNGKKHPKLNSALLKFAALTREAGQSLNGNNNWENLTPEEIEYAMQGRTKAETDWIEKEQKGTNESIADKTLFNSNNFISDPLRITGQLFLMSVGAGKMITPVAMGSQEAKAAQLKEIADKFEGNDLDRAKTFLDRYTKDRGYLSIEQSAKLLTLGIEQGMGLGMIALTQAKIWSVNTDDMGYKDYRAEVKIKNDYTGTGEKRSLPKEQQLDQSERLYKAILRQILIIRGDKVPKEKDER